MAIHCYNTCGGETDNSEEFSPINILSIDFDWIMAPSIEAYNNFADEFCLDTWKHINEMVPGANFEADYKKYFKLMQILAHKITPDTPIYVRNNHADILMQIDNMVQPYNICNIDHHHDLGYCSNQQIELEKLIEVYAAGNWAIKCLLDPKCQRYTWINNENSNINVLDCVRPYLNRFVMSTGADSTLYTDFDMIFICMSPDWVPPKYHPLFDALIEPFVKNIKK